MASTPKNICTHNTEQVITAKKTFTDSIISNRFELVDGTVINPPAIEVMEKNVEQMNANLEKRFFKLVCVNNAPNIK